MRENREEHEPTPLENMARMRMRSGYSHLAAAETLGALLAYCQEHDHANHHGRPYIKLSLKIEGVDQEMPGVPSVVVSELSTGIDVGLYAALVELHKALRDRGNNAIQTAEGWLVQEATRLKGAK